MLRNLTELRGENYKKFFMISACAFALLAAAPAALAQTNDEVIVTGSRIAKSNFTSAQPLTTLNEEAFEATGALTVSEALNELPSLGDSLEGGSSINSLNSGFGVGTQTVNLRNLGANRTLVLVNNRRHVGGDIGTSAVDLNSIPAALVARIDVVTGASSAVYGADAVTGVVNVVLKEDFDGTEVSVRGGISSEGDGEELAISAVHGKTFSGGDYVIAAEYSRQGNIIGADREFAQFDGSSSTGLSEVGNGSGVNPGGLFSFSGGGVGGFDTSGNFVQPFAERFQRVPFRSLQNETDRFVVSGRAGFDFSDSVSGYVEGTFANTKVNVQFDPQLAIFSNAGFASSGTAGFRFPTGPTVAVASTGGTLRAITRRFSEFGPRRAEIDRDLFRLSTGLDGDLKGGSTWHVNYQYGQVNATQTDVSTINKLRLVTAIDPVACGVAAGCQLVDLYGRGTIDPASLDWISEDLESNSKSEQHVLSAYMTGDFLEFNNNSLSYVAGVEYRDESATVRPNDALIAVTDPVAGSGNLVGLQGTRTFFGDTVGGYDVLEGFAELLVPLSDNFEVKLSGRVSDYSTVGTEYTYGVNANWAITDNFTARASFGTATRAPNINELFAPERASTTAITDPCDTADDAGNALTPAAGCGMFVGVGFNPSDLDMQIRGVSGGNPGLGSETADTFTLGAVFTPTSSTSISVDYFDISLSDVLAPAFSAQATLDRCIASGNAVFCDNVMRDGTTNFVTSIRSEQVNLAEESVAGLEIAIRQRFDLNNGEIIFDALLTHLLEHDRKVNDTAVTEDLVGRVDNIKNKINTSLRYENDTITLGSTLRYLDSAVQKIGADPVVATGNNIGSVVYVDVFGEYKFTEKLALQLGVENLFNEQSPVVTQLFENNGSADTTSAGIYDVRGAFGYATVKYKF